METGFIQRDIDPRILSTARCEHDFACLGGEAPCETMVFTNRDVPVVKCLGKQPCNKRHSYDGMQICTCPVQRKLHGLESG